MNATERGFSRVFSGVQPSGDLHLGNYLGAIVQFVELQRSHECLYCIVDLHAITTWQEPSALRENIRATAAAYIACGIDAKEQIIFAQSQVAAHAELAWVFDCVARIGWLNRMTQFKEKAGKDKENASVGLYVYPVLMAADILAYKATHVPVGEDQRQHLELARDIARKFNNDFAGGEEFFPLPEALITREACRVMSLRDGASKMSKSDASEMSRILLTDDAESIARKFRKAKTDAHPLPGEIAGLEGRREAENLVGIFAGLEGCTREEVLRRYGGGNFSVFKQELAELAVARLVPIGGEIRRLCAESAYLDAVLQEGAERAERLAAPILRHCRELVGLGVSAR